MPDPHYYYMLGHSPETRLLASLNGIPFFRTDDEPGGATRTSVADHLLVPGKNTFRLEIVEALHWGGISFSLAWEHEHDDATFECRWPDILGETPLRDVKFPFIHHAEFEVEEPLRRPVWMDAPVSVFGPEGTPELREAVKDLHATWSSGDVPRILDAIQLKVDEFHSTYPEDSTFTRESTASQIAAFFTLPTRPRPHQPEALRYDACANGRVAYVTRKDRGYPIHIEATETKRMRTDLWLTRHEGRWRLFR